MIIIFNFCITLMTWMKKMKRNSGFYHILKFNKWIYARVSVLLLFVLVLSIATEAWALCVQVKKANLRQGPSTKYEKLWEVYQYMPFKKLEVNGNWLKVEDVDGDIYWIYKNLTTEDYQCAVIKIDKANLREGPGTNYSQVSWSPRDKYYSMKVLKISGKWVRIEDYEGDIAWIHRSLVWIQ